jgi:hypothetical protein
VARTDTSELPPLNSGDKEGSQKLLLPPSFIALELRLLCVTLVIFLDISLLLGCGEIAGGHSPASSRRAISQKILPNGRSEFIKTIMKGKSKCRCIL